MVCRRGGERAGGTKQEVEGIASSMTRTHDPRRQPAIRCYSMSLASAVRMLIPGCMIVRARGPRHDGGGTQVSRKALLREPSSVHQSTFEEFHEVFGETKGSCRLPRLHRRRCCCCCCRRRRRRRRHLRRRRRGHAAHSVICAVRVAVVVRSRSARSILSAFRARRESWLLYFRSFLHCTPLL